METIKAKAVREEYERSTNAIEKNIKILMSDWKVIKAKQAAQLKDKPESWAGLGRGAELEYLENKLREMLEITIGIID